MGLDCTLNETIRIDSRGLYSVQCTVYILLRLMSGLIIESIVKAHLLNVHKIGGQPYHCAQCDYTTHSKYYLQAHQKRHKETYKTCPECGRQVKFLDYHISRGQCGNQKKARLPCDVCGKDFSSKDGLRRHKSDIHSGGKKHGCDLCVYRTYSSFNLKLHISKMHTKQPLEVVCEVCNKKTMGIDVHMKICHFDIYSKGRKELLHLSDNPSITKIEDSQTP